MPGFPQATWVLMEHPWAVVSSWQPAASPGVAVVTGSIPGVPALACSLCRVLARCRRQAAQSKHCPWCAAVLGRGLLRASGARKVPARCKAVSYFLWEQQRFLLYFIWCIQNTCPANRGSPLLLASLQVSWRSAARWLQCSGQVFLQSFYWERRRWCPKCSFMAKGACMWPQWCYRFHSLHAPGRSRGCLWCPWTQLGVVMLPLSPPGPAEGTWGPGTTLGAVGSQEAALDAPMPKRAEAWRGGNRRGRCQSTPALLAARMRQEQGLNPRQPMIEAHLMTLLNDTLHFLPLKVLNICARVIHYYYLIKDYLTHFHVSSNYKLKLFPLWPCSC